MIHHSLPGQRGLAVLQEYQVYQNSTCQRIGKSKDKKGSPFQMSMKRGSSCRNGQSSQQHHQQQQERDDRHFEQEQQNIPPPPGIPPPLPPKRTTSLLGTTQRKVSMRESVTMNPKRVSIATSSFWATDPDLGHFVSGWEIGRDRNLETMSSVWTERAEECMNIWGDLPAVKKGVIILQQRDKIWPRWKERYCILTRDYLHCFRRTTSIHRSGVRLSEMGPFIFKIRLADIQQVEWDMRKSGPIISVVLPQDSRICLRTPSDTYEALNSWYTLLAECVYLSKERRTALRNLHNGSTLTMDTLHSHRSTISNRTETQSEQSQVLGTSSSRGGHHQHHMSRLSDGSPNSSTKSKSTSMSASSSKSNSNHSDDSNASSHSSSSHQSSKENRHQINVNAITTQSQLKDNHSHHHQTGQSHFNNNNMNSSMSLRKNIGRMSLNVKLTPTKMDSVQEQQYAPLLNYVTDDSDEDYDETEDQLLNDPTIAYAIPNQKAKARASIAVDNPNTSMISRHGNNHGLTGPSMTLNDFVRNPWRNNNHIKTTNNSGMNGLASCSKNSIMSTGYSIPRDALAARNSSHSRQRPESWDQSVYYRQPSMGKSSPSFMGGRDSNFSLGRKMS